MTTSEVSIFSVSEAEAMPLNQLPIAYFHDNDYDRLIRGHEIRLWSHQDHQTGRTLRATSYDRGYATLVTITAKGPRARSDGAYLYHNCHPQNRFEGPDNLLRLRRE